MSLYSPFEMELAQLNDPEDIALFMADMGILASARDRLCRAAYELLGYISFFTVGSDEVRAWSIQENASVLTAAETIHSDLARGFIRAECFSYMVNLIGFWLNPIFQHRIDKLFLGMSAKRTFQTIEHCELTNIYAP